MLYRYSNESLRITKLTAEQKSGDNYSITEIYYTYITLLSTNATQYASFFF